MSSFIALHLTYESRASFSTQRAHYLAMLASQLIPGLLCVHLLLARMAGSPPRSPDVHVGLEDP